VTEADPTPEPTYATVQREVQRKFGLCLLRLQQYELLLKSLIAGRKLTGSANTLEERLAERIAETSTKTLGQLVGDLARDHLKPFKEDDEKAVLLENDASGILVGFEASISMPPDRLAAITQELSELVDMRNQLVHHFLEGFDLMSEPGCGKADAFLSQCNEKVSGYTSTLRGWIASSTQARALMLAHMAGNGFMDD
jgi:hypothetical protein